jgi:electron transport complex protein RnfB
MITTILTAGLMIAGLGLFLGVVIGVTAKFFAVASDPRVEQVVEMLPGANCGGCGFAGCADLAQAVVAGKVEVAACPVCPPEVRQAIAALLGLVVGESEKQVAVVLCGGDHERAKFAAQYNGVNDCRSAALVAGGAKGCRYGCLGLGSCARACPFGAMEMTPDGLAVVHPDLCVGCRKCVATCPRSLIRMVPAKYTVHVFCNSPDKGPAKRKVCQVSCIGCRKCVKAAAEGQMAMEGFLARTNYTHPEPAGTDLVTKAGCPTGCLHAPPGIAVATAKPEEAAA